MAKRNQLIDDSKQEPNVWTQPAIFNIKSNPNVQNFDPNFRLTTPIFPQTKNSIPKNVPIALYLKPGDLKFLPIVDYRNRYMCFCTACGAYLSFLNKVDPTKRTTHCSVCGNTITLSSDINFRESAEFVAPIYESIVGNWENGKGDTLNNFIFIIDISTKSIKTNITKNAAISLLKLLDYIPKNFRILILTFSDSITIYDSHKKRTLTIPDLNDITLPEIRFVDINESKEFLSDSLNDIANLSNSNSEFHCLTDALLLSSRLLNHLHGHIITIVSGCPQTGPHKISKPSRKSDYDYLEFKGRGCENVYLELAHKFNRSGVSSHIIMESEDGNNGLETLAVPSGLTSGLVYASKKLDFDNIYAFIEKVLFQNYYYNAKLNVIMTPGFVHPENVIGNGVTNLPNSILLSNFPADGSVMFCMSHPFRENHLPHIAFQARLVYDAADGTKRIRVITKSFTTSEKLKEVSDSVDSAVCAAASLKIFANAMLSTTISKCIDMLNSSSHFNELLSRSYIANELHPDGADGRISDITHIRCSDIFDIFLYLQPRTENFGPLNDCLALHWRFGITFYVRNDADPQWLRNALNCSQSSFPVVLPRLETPENDQLWNFVNIYGKGIQTFIHIM